MINFIDNFLNKITMYRLVLYYLFFLLGVAIIFCFLGLLPYNPMNLVFSAIFILVVSWLTNFIFAKVFKVPANFESVYITALILALIIAPIQPSHYSDYFSLAIWAAVWAMASKYIFAVKKKHIFNPAAFAVALTAITISQSASWWIGTAPMIVPVLLGGILIVRKIKRFDLFWSFSLVALATIIFFNLSNGNDLFNTLQHIIADTPILFFAFVMLTEPLTTPPTRILRIAYGALVGFLFAPQIHIGSFYSTPELALLAGNVFSYLVSPKEKLILKLERISKLATDVYDFSFKSDQKMAFRPGQYMEWTLGQNYPDNRGNRRYFTIASSPTEDYIKMGVKFYPKSSTFKKALAEMTAESKIVASQLAGDFVMPKNKNKKMVFIAGGIGITPFRSMIKYLLDKNETRSIVLLYSNNSFDDIAYKDIFDEAEQKLGIKTVYTLTNNTGQISADWRGYKGFFTEDIIKKEIPDYMERIFYLSGPRSMVLAFEKTLKAMGVKRTRIKTDYFPGFA